MEDVKAMRKPIVVPPEEGRDYPMGQIRAVFKADTDETVRRYSVSEWWLDPRTRGPHVHQHPEDHVFYVIAGTLSVRLNEDWRDAARGSYVIIPSVGGPSNGVRRRSGPALRQERNPGGFSLSAQSRFAAASSLAAADGSVILRLTKYSPVVFSNSGEDAR
jgi:hypothetical protein